MKNYNGTIRKVILTKKSLIWTLQFQYNSSNTCLLSKHWLSQGGNSLWSLAVCIVVNAGQGGSHIHGLRTGICYLHIDFMFLCTLFNVL
jgi:hypothetical protein